jgi:hypothetical protein
MKQHRRGELSFDHIIAIAFLAVILATGLAVLQFHLSRQIEKRIDQDVTIGYNLVLQYLRQDTQVGSSFEMLNDGVAIKRADNTQVSAYRTIEGSLYRFDKNEQKKLLIGSLDKASFRQHPELNNLLLVTLLPTDRMQIPFFTSFALRGDKP